jgi:cell division protein FtsB
MTGARQEKYVATFSLVPFFFINMKILLSIIILLVILLQYRLWSGDGGIEEITALQQQIDDLKEQVEEKKERNEALYAEVEDLRKGQEALEERARDELGMIREGETFFQVLE